VLATPNHGILQRDKTRMNITTPPSPTTAPSGVGNYGMSLTAGNHAPGSADAFASQLIEKNTSPLGFFGQARQLDTASLANQVVALSQKDSAKAADVLAAVEQQLSPSDFGDFQADLRTAREQLENGVATLKGNGGSEHSAVDKDAARNLAERLVQDASTEQASTGNSQSPTEIDTSKLAFPLEKLAEADPAEAQAVKAALNELLPLDQLAALNEDLGGGRSLSERLALIVESPGDAAVGIGKGMATDASDDMEFRLKVLTNRVGTELQVDSMLMKGRDPEASAALMQQAEAMYQKADGIDLPAPGIKNGAEAAGRDLASVADIATGNLTGIAKGKTVSQAAGQRADNYDKFPKDIAFDPNLRTHISTVDGFSQKKGVGGGHNLDAFNQAVLERNLKIVSSTKHPTSEGITHIRYQIPAVDRAGNVTGYKNKIYEKTVYDPKLISDDKILQLGQDAAAKKYPDAVSQGLREFSSEAGGIQFRVYVRDEIISNFHPEL